VLEPISYSHIYGPEIPGRVEISGSVASAFSVRPGDIILNRTSETDSELGLAAVYLGDEQVVFGGFVIRGRPIDDALDPKYSGYALRAKMIRSQIIPMGQGAVRANIGQQNLRRVLSPVPPKPEQRAIAAALSDMDALLGGLDLSIPFVIGASNVFLLYLIGLGMYSWIAILIVLLLGALIGWLNGILSYRLQGQALILTLGIGFAVSGLTQIVTSIGRAFAGNVFGVVPDWLKNLAAMNGTTFGLAIPPVILIWAVVAIVLIYGMKNTLYGRYLYALGGNRTSAARLSISERRYWVIAYMVSGTVAALTGVLLLGWSGGGFIGVGQPYLFMTLAAVVMGGTSLLGGQGGYGFTVIGVLVLQVLTSFLVGIGLKFEWQQFIFGLLILPMVALYARSPHIRTQI
jgi:ribose/xylose/arabinose/galactoside ABC-type transport system permease subunit